ncbi:MAG: Vitamin B12 dependent methionine synthase activation subunit [Clostridia bacterium]|nr:Vitamin B12 dependent methionine synthase activation subunit [Clostridia bacterium]
MIHTKTFEAIPVNRREIFRYAGCPSPGEAEIAVLNDCLTELEGKLSLRVCWREFPLTGPALPFTNAVSADMAKYLQGCCAVVAFGATIGLEIDRLIVRYGRLSPVKALFYQAIGAEQIESLCDAFCDALAEQYSPAQLRPRYSPGYGDLPLTVQKDLFAVLDCPRKIGLTLNDSMLMSPSKSVTAIVGVKQEIRDK